MTTPTDTPEPITACIPMVWTPDGNKLKSRIGDREYMLNITADGVTWAGITRVYPGGSAAWERVPGCSSVTLDEAKAAAQADFERRIQSVLAPAPVDHVLPIERYRHKKRGSIYTILHRGRLQVDADLDNEKVVVYRGDDGQVWVRPEYEFNDGRFESLAASEGSTDA